MGTHALSLSLYTSAGIHKRLMLFLARAPNADAMNCYNHLAAVACTAPDYRGPLCKTFANMLDELVSTQPAKLGGDG